MQLTKNTILITGGATGIGRGLAEAFHKLGNQVIIAGRTQKTLDETTAANPGMKSLTLDMADAQSIGVFAGKIASEFPALNVAILNAGIMKMENVHELNAENVEATIATNLTGVILMASALLPTLCKQKHATIMTVTSGLAYVPLAMTPTYCATKAAIHSYSQSLRFQLKKTPVEVVELVPPYVQTTLTGEHQAKDPSAMPLNDYISEVMDLIKSQPNATEIRVKRVEPMRKAAEQGIEKYDAFLQQFNDRMMLERGGARAGEG